MDFSILSSHVNRKPFNYIFTLHPLFDYHPLSNLSSVLSTHVSPEKSADFLLRTPLSPDKSLLFKLFRLVESGLLSFDIILSPVVLFGYFWRSLSSFMNLYAYFFLQL
jgi:hypothetical protein